MNLVDIPLLHPARAQKFRFADELQERREGLDQRIDVFRGPEALTVMGIKPDLVFCHEAWPHTDPDWEGRIFFTLTVEGFMYSFGCLSVPEEESASVGKTLVVNPMELHWLRPDPIVSTGWLALQWDVPAERAEEFSAALAEAVPTWNQPEFDLPVLGA